LPDYQGIGIGTKFLNEIAAMYVNKGYDFEIITSAKNMIMALNKSPLWAITRYSVAKRPTTGTIEKNRKNLRTNCKNATFFYVKQNKKR
jgi:GNAT superfamily N-acetyltransferase